MSQDITTAIREQAKAIIVEKVGFEIGEDLANILAQLPVCNQPSFNVKDGASKNEKTELVRSLFTKMTKSGFLKKENGFWKTTEKWVNLYTSAHHFASEALLGWMHLPD